MDDRNAVLEIQHLTHGFGPKTVLFDINLRILAGEFVALVGPSGCGKSTLLRAVLGANPAQSGQVVMHMAPGGREPRQIRKPSRDIGVVYQRYSLFPDKTALHNVALGLMFDESSVPDRLLRWVPFHRRVSRRKLSWARLRKIHLDVAAKLLRKLKLADAMHCYPHELSGGMCQRVAIAQALVMKPRILLLDEPFGALDEATREELQNMLLELYLENTGAVKAGKDPPYTVVIVTHELREALLVADRLLGLSPYWDSASHHDPRAKGASSIIYDGVAPVFAPHQVRDYSVFLEQLREIREKVFDPEVLQNREEMLRFWGQVHDGLGEGVLHDGNGRP